MINHNDSLYHIFNIIILLFFLLFLFAQDAFQNPNILRTQFTPFRMGCGPWTVLVKKTKYKQKSCCTCLICKILTIA